MPTAIALSLALLVAAASPVAATAQTERFYDPQGRYTGRATTSGATTRYYDADGRLSGTSRATRRPPGAAAPMRWPPPRQRP